MKTHTEDQRRAALDIARQHRALAANRGIYSRRHGPCLKQLLADAGALQARCIRQISRLQCETGWGAQDAQNLAEFARAVARFGNLRPEFTEQCRWHADRLNELVRQHAALARLEDASPPRRLWPGSRDRNAVASDTRTPQQARRHTRA